MSGLSDDRPVKDLAEFCDYMFNLNDAQIKVLAEATAPGYADKFRSTVKACVQTEPKAAVLVFVLKGKSILLGSATKEKPMFLPPVAELQLELGDSFEQCGTRAVKELTGLDVEKLESLTVSDKHHTKCDEMDYAFDFLRGVLRNEDQILQPEKFPGWDWHDWDNLPTPLFSPLEKLMKNGFNPFKTQ